MKRLFLLFVFLVSQVAVAQPITPADLTRGGYVIYFRHALADSGTDCKDPSLSEWWKSTDQSKTRQLDEEGKRQARVIGEAFRKLRIPVGKVLCSEFRRAQDTARLMGLGEVTPEKGLTPLSGYGELGPRLLPLLSAYPESGTNTVLVAHGHVLPMFDELSEGSAMVFSPDSNEPLGTITFEEWEKSLSLLEGNPKTGEFALVKFDGATHILD